MPALIHTALIACAIALAYGWLHIPALVPYTLQAFAVTMLVYFIIKRFGKAKLWHLAPDVYSLEMPVLTFAFQLLIGGTGNFHSLFFPLTFVHLFFLVLATETTTAIFASLMIMFFHYLMVPDLGLETVSQAVTIPLVMVFFLFAKYQYQEVQEDKNMMASSEAALAACTYQEHELRHFLQEFVMPKLMMLESLSQTPQENQTTIQGQLTLLQTEIQKILQRLS